VSPTPSATLFLLAAGGLATAELGGCKQTARSLLPLFFFFFFFKSLPPAGCTGWWEHTSVISIVNPTLSFPPPLVHRNRFFLEEGVGDLFTQKEIKIGGNQGNQCQPESGEKKKRGGQVGRPREIDMAVSLI
jgi:hypothetical protein